MEPRQHQLPAADGTLLHLIDYPLAPELTRGSIVIMHGLGEHCGRFLHVARFFNQCGLSVRTYDHRGHGRSGGARGDIPAGDAILQDAQIVIEDFATQFAKPPILFGHSMGGLFALRFALGKMTLLSGLILSSPALAIRMNGLEKMLLALLRRIAPGLGIPNGLKVDGLSRDKAVCFAYQNDPLVHSKISARLLLRMLDAIRFCHEQAGSLSLPTLMVVAGNDQLVDPSGSRAIFPLLPKSLATLHWYDEFYHELLNDVDAYRVFDDIERWLVGQDLGGRVQAKDKA